jgi:hypothetical protein
VVRELLRSFDAEQAAAGAGAGAPGPGNLWGCGHFTTPVKFALLAAALVALAAGVLKGRGTPGAAAAAAAAAEKAK